MTVTDDDHLPGPPTGLTATLTEQRPRSVVDATELAGVDTALP